jgi:3-oxoacyl-[acyl-carrier protein] reductase
MSVGRLTGLVALITGASRGIGAAVARAFVAEGAAVALGHAPEPEMTRLARALADDLVAGGARAVALAADLAEVGAADELVTAARAALGPIDVLVANAAASGEIAWRDITVEQWDHVQAVNLRGTWLLARAAYPDLAASRSASIITVTSVMVQTGQPGKLHYTASKAGIIGLTRALAREVGPDGVRVNAVMPGAIRTEYEEALSPDPAEAAAQVLPLQALQRRGFPTDLAGVFVFLASPDSGFITGQVINVDGGWVHY